MCANCLGALRSLRGVLQKGYNMKTIRRFFLFVILFSVGLAATPALAGGPGGCPPWRPCGPGNSFGGNRLIGQQFLGVDFRPSCASHDACLASGVSRRQCDRQFYGQMRCACENSPHPVLCRMKAFQFFAGARIFGGLYY
jgi:hypothetical protein